MNSNLVFICGFPSSGTDLLKNIINAHSDISIGGEFPFLPKMVNSYPSYISASEISKVIAEFKRLDVYHNFGNPNFSVTQLEKKNEYSLSEIYASMLTDRQTVWKGNKTPQNTENIDRLKKMFPNAKFILIVRDIRDVCLSAQKKWGKNKYLWAAKWDQRMLRGNELLNSLDKADFLIIKYENLLNNLNHEAHKICSFLGVGYQDIMLNHHLNVKDSIEGKLNYGKSLITNNSEKWQRELTKTAVRRIEEIAFDSLELFDYQISLAEKSKPITSLEKTFGKIHDFNSLLFVGNRARKQSNNASNKFKNIVFELQKHLS